MKLRHQLFIVVFSGCFAIAAGVAAPASEARLDEVARRGVRVMPFNLKQTLHVFTKTQNGGIQQVIVKHKSDNGQVSLIREHLKKIADQFRQGDFSDPMRIHGQNMPGLAALKTVKPGTLTINYAELTDGAQIDYATDDADIVLAIHQWFDAQLIDHARHAIPGHKHHSIDRYTDLPKQ